ncbi:hypothetical protein GFY24_32420 [Nocardia sp. SYP-A9097]|uniref:IS1096 element passenger TnpR family protein n=1 Tax=Nocardia sp. SYP-A9097 TaxID=2663237 RepID=UPI00129A84C3|nr:hypothetical protein [Nocardia sp. SYP-A9097]MRH92091.1 hypothetical protein [Nocardia sp. SYP-A9097]
MPEEDPIRKMTEALNKLGIPVEIRSGGSEPVPWDNLLRHGGTFENMFDPAPVSPRRPRRADTVRYRVRVESVKPNGRSWRVLEVASDFFLDEVQELLQGAFGWKAKQRYRFGSAEVYGHRETEHYLCRVDSEGRLTPGEVADEFVRLDEVLTAAGDELFHRYGAGKQWQRVIRLEEIREFGAYTPRAECACGPRTLDVEAVNLELSSYGYGVADRSPVDTFTLPNSLAWILGNGFTRGFRQLRHLMGQAMLDVPVTVDAQFAADAMRPYLRLLEHIGVDGVELTTAGALPRHMVAALFTELDMSERWARQEVPAPIAELRHTAARFDLIERDGSRLVLSDLGLRLLADPVALWWHIAERLPRGSTHEVAVVYVLAAATDTDDPALTAAGILDDVHGPLGDGPVSEGRDVVRTIREAWIVFECLRMTPLDRLSFYRTRHPAMRTFARAVLQQWPRNGLIRWFGNWHLTGTP